MTCIVCWEDMHHQPHQASSPISVVLLPCRYTACKACIQHWMQTCEQRGHEQVTCPHCRQEIDTETCMAVLGRAFLAKRRQTTPQDGGNDDDAPVDDFTMTWLQEHGARQCLSCGAWMTQEDEDSNEPIMCLCGYCYCWYCDNLALGCGCEHQEVYDTLTGEDVFLNRDDLLLATAEDCLNFRAFLKRRRNGGTYSDDEFSGDSSENDLTEEVFVEEPAEAHLVPIFDCYEEAAGANFLPFTDWLGEEDLVES